MKKIVMFLILVLFIASNMVGGCYSMSGCYQRNHNVKRNVMVTPVKGDVYTYVSYTDHSD